MKRYLLIALWLLPLIGIGQNSSGGGTIPTLFLDSVAGNWGDTVTVSMRAIDFTNIYYMTGTMLYDSAEVDFIGFTQDSLPDNLTVSDNDSGQVTFSWNYGSITDYSFPDSVPLLSIDYKLIGTPGSTTPLRFANSPFPLRCANAWSTFSAWETVVPDTISGAIHIIGNPVSTSYHTKEDLLLYPNPTTSTIRIQLPENNLNATRTSLYDISGRLVHQQHFNLNMDVSHLDRGTYIVVAETEEGNFRGTVQKQ